MRGIKSVEIIDRETLGVRQSVRELMYAARRGQAKVCVVVSRRDASKAAEKEG
jgi:hypothetical protein